MATSIIKSLMEDISANLTTDKGTFVVKQAHRIGKLIVIAFEINLSASLGAGSVIMSGLPSVKGTFINIPVISGGTTKIAYTDGTRLASSASMSGTVAGTFSYIEA